MSFVGPRPQIPKIIELLNSRERRILDVRPGITGPASIKYLNEEKILTKVEKPLKYNREVVLPDKVRINMLYIEKKSFFHDLKIIFYTLIRKKLREYE